MMKTWKLAILFLSSPVFAALTPKSDLPDVSLKELLSMPEKNRERVAFKQNKPNLYPDLLKMAFNKEEGFQYRWKALTLAATLGGSNSTGDIQKACQSEEWFMKNACLLALQRINAKKSSEFAQKLLADKALVVRSAAVRVLAASLTPEKRDLLWDELNKDYNYRLKQSLWVRSQIIEALAKSPEKSELPLFAKSLRD